MTPPGDEYALRRQTSADEFGEFTEQINFTQGDFGYFVQKGVSFGLDDEDGKHAAIKRITSTAVI